jgi:hypothetical protein
VSASSDTPVYATRALVDVLLELAQDADPRAMNVALAVTPAADLTAVTGPGTPLDALDATAPVFADFYFPAAGDSLEAVFGVDLATPAGVQGRFLTHPNGDPGLTVTDDFAARVLLAIPPYDRDDVRAYDRTGRRELVLVAAESSEPDIDY